MSEQTEQWIDCECGSGPFSDEEAVQRHRDQWHALAEPESTSIAFGGEACEGFADWIDSKAGKDYYVRLTTFDGRQFDAVIVGSGQHVRDESGNGWYDAVTYLPADPETGFAVEGEEPRTVRVKEVYIY